jgi:hypothetical protein
MSSIVFDIVIAEELNKMAMEIDNRLYLFAYYCPKQNLNISDEHKFWCGVTNLYGLFWDCAPFINTRRDTSKSLVDLFMEHKFVSINESKTIRSFLKYVSSLRAVFCHNCTEDNYFSRLDQKRVKQLFMQLCGSYPCDIEKMETIGDNSHWKKALNWLTNEADKCIFILKGILEKVKISTNKNIIVNNWLEAIASWYKNNDSLLNTVLYDKYNLMCLIQFPNPNSRPILNQSQIIKGWKHTIVGEQTNEDKWKNRCLAIVLSMDKPALPCEVMRKNINQAELKLLSI